MIKPKTTLSKEQIENIEKSGSSHVNGTLLQAVSARDFKKICDMALNSIPHPYDPKDKGTWPDEEGIYATWCAEKETWLDDSPTPHLDYWDLDHFIAASDDEFTVTHYMKIPAIPEEKE